MSSVFILRNSSKDEVQVIKFPNHVSRKSKIHAINIDKRRIYDFLKELILDD